MTEHDAQRQGASQHRGAGDEGSGQPGGRELARLLHDVADAQVKMAGLIEASRQELRDLVTRCERAAEQISRAAESLALAAGVGGAQGGQSGQENGHGSGSRAQSRREGRARRRVRPRRSLGPEAPSGNGPKAEADSRDGHAFHDGGQLREELERLVAEAAQLLQRVERLNRA